MKLTKVLCIIFAMVFALSSLQIMVFATDNSKDDTYSSHMAGEVTITINNEVSPETKAKIYAHFNGQEVAPTGTRGITCTLFGHNLDTGTTTNITHKARTTAPKCLEKTYSYEICTRCDYSNYTLVGSRYIYCCA